jgi:hypothetical protein
MAGAFCPKRFDITNCTNPFRFASTSNGCTVAACAASNAPATARACPAVPVALVAAVFSHMAYGAAAAVIACDAGPCHA